MKYFIVLLAGALFFGACGSHKQPANTTKTDSLPAADSSKNAFFPVADFLESEILRIDSLPLPLKKFTTRNGKTDSIFILPAEFNTLAMKFLPAELHNGGFEKTFTETSFMDKTTQSITFSYANKATEQSLRRVDVIVLPGNGAMHVKSIYMETSRSSGDSSIVEKLYWRAGRSFQIGTNTLLKNKDVQSQQLRVTWNEEEDE
ncbi:MAG: hypothetical protein JST68_16845 [Bacteroidetes bacterium]|nr:hypothetical protein [Bacteroidota bacterium]